MYTDNPGELNNIKSLSHFLPPNSQTQPRQPRNNMAPRNSPNLNFNFSLKGMYCATVHSGTASAY